MADSESSRVLYVVVCAAPAASNIQALVSLAQAESWRVHVIATPDALAFLNLPAIEKITGDPVRSAYHPPNAPDPLPPADAVIVAPATFNTINKWATGIADNFAVALLCELTGFGVPTIAVPLLKDALARHPAFSGSLNTLRTMGVQILFNPDAPRAQRMPSWSRILDELGL